MEGNWKRTKLSRILAVLLAALMVCQSSFTVLAESVQTDVFSDGESENGSGEGISEIAEVPASDVTDAENLSEDGSDLADGEESAAETDSENTLTDGAGAAEGAETLSEEEAESSDDSGAEAGLAAAAVSDANVIIDLNFTDATGDEDNLDKFGYQWNNTTKTLTFSSAFNNVDAADKDVTLPADAAIVLNGGANVTVQNINLSGGTTKISGTGTLTVKENNVFYGKIQSASEGVSYSLTVDGATLVVENTISNGNTNTTGNALTLMGGAKVTAHDISWTGAEGVSLTGGSTLTVGSTDEDNPGRLFAQKIVIEDKGSVINAKSTVGGYPGADFSGIYNPDDATNPVNYLPDGYSIKNKESSACVIDADGNDAENFTIKYRAINTVTVSCEDVTYGKTPNPTATADYGSSTVSFTYSQTETGAYGEFDTTWGVGSFYVKASVAAGTATVDGREIEYHSASQITEAKIVKADPAVTAAPEENKLIDNTEAPTITPTEAPTTEAAHTHTYGSWTVTKKATVLSKGVKQRTCSICGHVQKKNISRLSKPDILPAKGVRKGAGGIRLTWKKYSGAEGYEIYGAVCGDDYEFLARVKSAVTKYTCKNLENNKHYKFYVKAYCYVDGEKVYLAKSPNMHVAMKKAGMTNASKIKVNKAKVSLEAGETFRLKVTVTRKDKTKKLLSHVKSVRYYSSNKAVATVTSSGKIKAKACGTCKIYVVAPSGRWKAVTVTVK